MITTTFEPMSGYTGTIPERKPNNENERALAVWNFLNFTSNTMFTQINESFIPKLNNFKTQLNTTYEAIQEDKQTILTAKEQTLEAKETAVNSVSALPDGKINDTTVSATDTWSSFKIDNKLIKDVELDANIVAQNNIRYKCTNVAAITITAIENANFADNFEVYTGDNAEANSITIEGGTFVYLDTEDTQMVLNINNALLKFFFDGNKWRITRWF